MKIYETLKKHLDDGNLEQSVLYSIDVIKNKKISIVDLYQDVLAKILNDISCDQSDEECIWYEHQRTAIVRNIVDALFPYLIEEKAASNNQKVLVVCPSEEYHEIGAKMAADFFYLLGYETTFVGANTPLENIVSAVKMISPDYLAISVTNYYNIVSAKKIIESLRNINPNLKILAGGQAFLIEGAGDIVGVDQLVFSFDDIKALEGHK
ncbi:MAG: cobalamin B12-binding domain-containing protein [Candidatus Izemoplasmataceae bacterium]